MKHPTSVIKGVQLTEKGTMLSESRNQYLLRVSRDANKIEIKKAVQDRFNVSVLAVNTMNFQGKKKLARNRRVNKRPDWKRAVVTLKPGDRLDVV